MRFLVRCTLPVAAGNAFVKSADWQSKMDQIMGDLKPETAYFCLDGGAEDNLPASERERVSPATRDS